MVDFGLILAYALTFGIPSVIIGFGAFADEIKVASMVAFISLISFLTYFTYNSMIPYWVLITVLILISILFVFAFRSIIGGSS